MSVFPFCLLVLTVAVGKRAVLIGDIFGNCWGVHNLKSFFC